MRAGCVTPPHAALRLALPGPIAGKVNDCVQSLRSSARALSNRQERNIHGASQGWAFAGQESTEAAQATTERCCLCGCGGQQWVRALCINNSRLRAAIGRNSVLTRDIADMVSHTRCSNAVLVHDMIEGASHSLRVTVLCAVMVCCCFPHSATHLRCPSPSLTSRPSALPFERTLCRHCWRFVVSILALALPCAARTRARRSPRACLSTLMSCAKCISSRWP